MVNSAMGDALPLPLRELAVVFMELCARTVEEEGWIVTNSAAVTGPGPCCGV